MPLRKVLGPRSKAKGKPKSGALYFVTIIPVVSFVLGAITKGYTFYDGVATKALVEIRLKDIQHQMDVQLRIVMKDATEHADRMRQDILHKSELMFNEIKIKNAVFDERFELMLKNQNEMKQMEAEALRKVRK